MKKISVVIAGRHSTSICLEEEFWRELKRIALVKHKSINELVTEIDHNKKTDNLCYLPFYYYLSSFESFFIVSLMLENKPNTF